MEWRRVPIHQIADVNPRDGDWSLADDEYVSFIPMRAVSDETASISEVDPRLFAEVRRGYTPFRESDILFAKITPCMENGKIAIAHSLTNGVGFGSTEFHVLRAGSTILPEYLYYFMRQESFRSAAKQHMRGGAGQQRVPEDFLRNEHVPLPPPSEQRRIVDLLDQADHLRRLRTEADAKANRILPALLVRALGNPANWGSEPRYRPLGDFVDPVSGATPSKTTERFWSGEVPWVSPKDMKTDFLSDSQDHVSQAAVDETNLNVIEQGNTLIVVRGMILVRDVPVAINRNPVTINQDMKALVPKTKEITGAYIWATLHLARRKLQALVRTAGHGTRKLDTPDLMQFPIPPPDPDRLKLVASLVENHRVAVEQRQKSKKVLDSVFAVTLNKAFDGSLTASWRNRHMEDLVREMKRLERTAVDVAP